MSATCAWCQDLAAKRAEQGRDEARAEVAKLQTALKSVQDELALVTKDRNQARSESHLWQSGETNEPN